MSIIYFQNREKQKYTVAVKHDAHPEQLIREAIYKRIRNSDQCKTQEEKIKVVEDYQSSYVLKMAGSDQYFLLPVPISQYKYIRSSIAKNEIPQMMLMSKKGVYDNLPICDFHVPAFMRKTLSVPNRSTKSLWHLDAPFSLHVVSASYVNVKEADLIYVRIGIFHGTEALCEVKQTKFVAQNQPRWDEWIVFEDMFYLDLPRAAKLCVSICAVKKRKNRDDTTMLCWGNISLFDWRSNLLTDKFSLNLWSVPRGFDDLLNPLGCVGANPMKDSPCLELGFQVYPQDIRYPTSDDFKEYNAFAEDTTRKENCNAIYEPPSETITESEQEMLLAISRRDPLAEVSEQEKVALWKLRRHCLDIPDILPRFLDAVKWNSRSDITQVLLKTTSGSASKSGYDSDILSAAVWAFGSLAARDTTDGIRVARLQVRGPLRQDQSCYLAEIYV